MRMELQAIPAPALKLDLRMARVTDEDYAAIASQILRETGGREWFEIDYPLDVFNLNVCGEVERSYAHSGDGYHTPREWKEDVRIIVEFYECRDEDGDLTQTDFDPNKL